MTPVMFPDPRLAALTVLRAIAPNDATYGTKPLDAFADAASPTMPYVMVAVDAVFRPRTPLETATIRVTVWHDDEFACNALARTLRANLLAYEGGADVRSFGALTGPIPTSDPDTGTPLSTFTVAARLRPTI